MMTLKELRIEFPKLYEEYRLEVWRQGRLIPSDDKSTSYVNSVCGLDWSHSILGYGFWDYVLRRKWGCIKKEFPKLYEKFFTEEKEDHLFSLLLT